MKKSTLKKAAKENVKNAAGVIPGIAGLAAGVIILSGVFSKYVLNEKTPKDKKVEEKKK